MIKIHIFVLVVLTSTINCEFGIDLSTLTSVDSFKCFLSNYTFLNVRAWRSYGAFDPNSVQTLANAKQAGFHVDNIGVYMFPCSFGKPAADQVKQMVENLKNSQYSSIWIDMESNSSPQCGWGKNYDANCQFTAQLVNQALKSGKKVGIYASRYMWTTIMGGVDKCTKFSNLPLWYAHYDKNPSFNDWQPYGGWEKPYIKQFQGTTPLCDASVDLNYRP